MKAYEPTVPSTTPVTLNFLTDLGANAAEGEIANIGEAEFKIKLWLGASSTIPFTLPPYTRLVFPCSLTKIDIIPVNDLPAYYQAVVN